MSNNLDGDKVADQVSLGSAGLAAHTVRPEGERLHSDVDGVRVVVSREMLAGFYCCVLAANLLLMLMTLLSDIQSRVSQAPVGRLRSGVSTCEADNVTGREGVSRDRKSLGTWRTNYSATALEIVSRLHIYRS